MCIELISSRKWGEPPLKKPKELKGEKQAGTVPYGHKCQCPVYVTKTHIYLKHRDWFSPCISIQKAKDAGIIDDWDKRFIYNDRFGGVVLRCEAWLHFPLLMITGWKGYLPAYGLLMEFEKFLGLEEGTLYYYDWVNMFEELIKLCKPYLPRKPKIGVITSLLDLPPRGSIEHAPARE